MLPRGITARELKPHEIRYFRRNRCMGSGNQDFYGEQLGGNAKSIFFRGCFGGTMGTIFARERKKIPVSVKSRGSFSAGMFPRTALNFTKQFTTNK